MKTYLRKRLFSNAYSNFLHIAKNWRKHKCPSTGEQKITAYLYKATLISNKKKLLRHETKL